MKTIKTLASVLFLIFMLMTIGCVNYAKSAGYKMDGGSDNYLRQNELLADAEGMSIERKVLYSAHLTLTVKVPDSATAAIARIALHHKGYTSRSGSQTVVIRVKSTQLQEAIREISALGKVTDRSISGQDVTDEYMDHQIRLENVQKARTRYLELLAQATSVDEALKVERELERLNETIDLLKGKMARMDHLEQFSTITVYLREKVKPGPLGYIGIGLYHTVKWLFVRN
jgi:hypothetical protein